MYQKFVFHEKSTFTCDGEALFLSQWASKLGKISIISFEFSSRPSVTRLPPPQDDSFSESKCGHNQIEVSLSSRYQISGADFLSDSQKSAKFNFFLSILFTANEKLFDAMDEWKGSPSGGTLREGFNCEFDENKYIKLRAWVDSQ